MKFDTLIIGGGLAGLTCGIRCAQAGLKTGIIAKGGKRPGFCLRHN